MPLDVGSQLDLYNTKYTELHLNIYKYKYLKGYVFYLLCNSGNMVTELLVPQIRTALKSLLKKKNNINFTPTLSHSPLLTSQAHK